MNGNKKETINPTQYSRDQNNMQSSRNTKEQNSVIKNPLKNNKEKILKLLEKKGPKT